MTIAGSRNELSNQMEVGLDSFQRQVAERRMIMRIQARLLQALKPWNWRSRRQSSTRKELVTSTAAKPWTHHLVSSILRSFPDSSSIPHFPSVGKRVFVTETSVKNQSDEESFTFFFMIMLQSSRVCLILFFVLMGVVKLNYWSDENDVKTLYYNVLKASGKEVSSQNNEEVLGNGLTPSAADVAVYADLHSSVTAMMLRRRFLGKLPKPSLLRKYVSQSHSKTCVFLYGSQGWVEIAVYRYLRKLDISFSSVKKENMVANSLFTCKTLVILKP
ncbi:hypothetical protein HID58_018666 [Brassica napus]|uniref:Uncharacterized protein n=1 Tax=Brassica napus TaxID=3708 RepID=A0ABQ8DD59_BRANA|nr:hypothetical protein HID58_018666 [Brassica napus]